MKAILEHTFNDDNFAVCVKDSNGKVLMQNPLCSGICGDYTNTVCDIGCMELYAKDESHQWNEWGSRIYNNTFVHNAFYDITLLCSNDYLITFLQPLKEKYKMALAYYKDKKLTKRELEVISLIVQGKSNQTICGQLSVSMATLKTHLNNIYKKIHDLGGTPKYIPHKRLSSWKSR
jgi:DNA-binding CsgD family transcriptional regulator